MSVAGLIMQQLCMNKFVSPTTGATISSLLAGNSVPFLFAPARRCGCARVLAFVSAIAGTWIFVAFIPDSVQDGRDGAVSRHYVRQWIGGITNYLAYKYEMTQALSSWLVGHFSLVMKGRYELVILVVPFSSRGVSVCQSFQYRRYGQGFRRTSACLITLCCFWD